jgi:2-oxoglutarate dehydrogenase complex dehydrogenase (E1) component-like enzyme
LTRVQSESSPRFRGSGESLARPCRACDPLRKIAYEIEHISDHAERVWLRQAIESGRFRGTLEADERRSLLRRLAQVEAFETYLRRAFIGQKQFSIEGLDVLVPMLDEAVELLRAGAHEVSPAWLTVGD